MWQWYASHGDSNDTAFWTELDCAGRLCHLYWLEQSVHADYIKTREMIDADRYSWCQWLDRRASTRDGDGS